MALYAPVMREDACLQACGGNPALDLHDWIISLQASTRGPVYSRGRIKIRKNPKKKIWYNRKVKELDLASEWCIL
jgi:hypothetical protein